MTLLHIDASPRGARSHSRALTAEFVAKWTAAHPDAGVVYRDLGCHPVPFVDEAWIAAAFSAPRAHTPALRDAIRLSDWRASAPPPPGGPPMREGRMDERELDRFWNDLAA